MWREGIVPLTAISNDSRLSTAGKYIRYCLSETSSTTIPSRYAKALLQILLHAAGRSSTGSWVDEACLMQDHIRLLTYCHVAEAVLPINVCTECQYTSIRPVRCISRRGRKNVMHSSKTDWKQQMFPYIL